MKLNHSSHFPRVASYKTTRILKKIKGYVGDVYFNLEDFK